MGGADTGDRPADHGSLAEMRVDALATRTSLSRHVSDPVMNCSAYFVRAVAQRYRDVRGRSRSKMTRSYKGRHIKEICPRVSECARTSAVHSQQADC